MNETLVTVVGNVASELRVRRFGPDGDRVVGFRVASSERRWDRETQSWIDGDRFSAWVTCWRRLGEGVVGSLVKGDPVVVAGRLSVREYEADGQRRYSTEIVASAVGPDLSRSTASVARRRLTAVPDAGADSGSGTGDEVDSPTGTSSEPGGVGASAEHTEDALPDTSVHAELDEVDDADEQTGSERVAVGSAG